MNTYRFQAAAAYRSAPTLTAEALLETLAGVVVRSVVAAPYGGYEVDLQLDRGNHHQAIAEIHDALLQSGFNVAQIVITEWATSVVEGAIFGTGGGAAIGSATKDPVAFFILTALGLVVGAAVGRGIYTAKALYQADRMNWHPYGWRLTQLVLPQPSFEAQPWLQT
jgi:hypothetical protein